MDNKNADLAWLLLIFCLVAVVTIGCCAIFKKPLDKAFNEAMIIQNGKTYLVPYSRIILIQTD